MRTFYRSAIILFLALIFVGCAANSPAVATLAPTVSIGEEGAVAGESPRVEGEGPSGSIPPTWTPGPDVEGLPVQQPTFATRAPDETYVVQPGDTLAEIAESFDVELDRLVRANDIQNVDFIFTGQVLTIPR